MENGTTISNNYSLDLDSLTIGSRVGMMRCEDGTLHFYLDGKDMGVACRHLPSGKTKIIINV